MTYGMNLPMLTHWQRTSALRRGLVRRAILSLFCLLGGLALFPQTVFAHPMGNFSVNHYSRLSLTQDGVAVLYIVDMAEIPTHAERTVMDSNGDQEISSAEEQSY